MNSKRIREADDIDYPQTQDNISNHIQSKRSCLMQATTVIGIHNNDQQSKQVKASNANLCKQSPTKSPVVSLCGGGKPVPDDHHDRKGEQGTRQFHQGPSSSDHKEFELGGRDDPTVQGELLTATDLGLAGIVIPSAVATIRRGAVEVGITEAEEEMISRASNNYNINADRKLGVTTPASPTGPLETSEKRPCFVQNVAGPG